MQQIKKYFGRDLRYGIILRKDHILNPAAINPELIIENPEDWYLVKEPLAKEHIALKAEPSLTELLDRLQVQTSLTENLSIEYRFHSIIIPGLIACALSSSGMLRIEIVFDPSLNPKYPEGSLEVPGVFKDIPELEWPITQDKIEEFDRVNGGRLNDFITQHNIR